MHLFTSQPTSPLLCFCAIQILDRESSSSAAKILRQFFLEMQLHAVDDNATKLLETLEVIL